MEPLTQQLYSLDSRQVPTSPSLPLYPRLVSEPAIQEAAEEATRAALAVLDELLPAGAKPESEGISSNFQGTLKEHILALLEGKSGARFTHHRQINALFGSEDSFGRLGSPLANEGYTVVRRRRTVEESYTYFNESLQQFVPLESLPAGDLFTRSELAVKAVFSWLAKEGASPRDCDYRLCLLSFASDGPLRVVAVG